jgi:hypothetical protein
MNEYRSVGVSSTKRLIKGRDRNRRDAYGVQRATHEGPRPLGLEIEPFTVERRGTHFLTQDPMKRIHFVRVYADGTEERI